MQNMETSGRETLAQIWNTRQQTFDQQFNLEKTKAREIAERQCKAALQTDTKEMRAFLREETTEVIILITIPNEDANNVREFNSEEPLTWGGSHLICAAAREYLLQESNQSGMQFLYSKNGCVGNQYKIIIKKLEGDK